MATAPVLPTQMAPAPSSARRAGDIGPLLGYDDPCTIVGVSLLGLSRADVERVVALVAETRQKVDFVPVLVTDCDDFALFRRHRLYFEYVPPAAIYERYASDLDWRLFVQRRLALIRQKWEPARVINFGPASPEPFAGMPLADGAAALAALADSGGDCGATSSGPARRRGG